MKTRFKTHAGALLPVFVFGALYGALLNYSLTEIPMSTGPATSVEVAKNAGVQHQTFAPADQGSGRHQCKPGLGIVNGNVARGDACPARFLKSMCIGVHSW